MNATIYEEMDDLMIEMLLEGDLTPAGQERLEETLAISWLQRQSRGS